MDKQKKEDIMYVLNELRIWFLVFLQYGTPFLVIIVMTVLGIIHAQDLADALNALFNTQH